MSVLQFELWKIQKLCFRQLLLLLKHDIRRCFLPLPDDTYHNRQVAMRQCEIKVIKLCNVMTKIPHMGDFTQGGE